MARLGRSGALALPVERRRSWRVAWRWCSIVCSLAGRRAACRGAVLRQMVDQRIDGGPCRRLVPPKDWPEAPALAGQDAWDDYNWDDVWGPDITVITPTQLMPPPPTECDYHSTEFMQGQTARYWEFHLRDSGAIAPLRDSGAIAKLLHPFATAGLLMSTSRQQYTDLWVASTSGACGVRSRPSAHAARTRD